MHYTIEKLTSLFNKPNCFITLRAEQQQRHHSHIETPQQPGTTVNGSSRPYLKYVIDGFEPPLFEAMNTEFEAPDSDSDAEDWLGGAGLVEKPRMVNKIDINYAKIAKKVCPREAASLSLWGNFHEGWCESSENVHLDQTLWEPLRKRKCKPEYRTGTHAELHAVLC